MDGNAVKDMGLSVDDVSAITAGYLYATSVLYPIILQRGKFVWDQTLNHDPYAPLNGDCPREFLFSRKNDRRCKFAKPHHNPKPTARAP